MELHGALLDTSKSPKGFFCWLSATWIEQFHGLSCMVTLLA